MVTALDTVLYVMPLPYRTLLGIAALILSAELYDNRVEAL